MKHRRLKPIIFCSNDNPGGLTLTCFTARYHFCNLGFYMGNGTMMDSLISFI